MKKILLVEDNELNMELALQVLEDDFEVVTAENGEEAIAAVAEHSPELVLMDLSMPVMDGWTAIAKLREQEAHKKLPIIALSAHAIPAEMERAFTAGADEFVTKPLDDEELLKKIRLLIGD
jgi:CheY-like chemotaxis protein